MCLTENVHLLGFILLIRNNQELLRRSKLFLDMHIDFGRSFSLNSVSFGPRFLLHSTIVISQVNFQILIKIYPFLFHPVRICCVHKYYGFCSGLGELCLGRVL